MISTTQCNFYQRLFAKDILVSKASRPPSHKIAMTYQHLSQGERYQIYILIKDGKTQAQIAKLLERYKSTISRELAWTRGSKDIHLNKPAC